MILKFYDEEGCVFLHPTTAEVGMEIRAVCDSLSIPWMTVPDNMSRNLRVRCEWAPLKELLENWFDVVDVGNQ